MPEILKHSIWVSLSVDYVSRLSASNSAVDDSMYHCKSKLFIFQLPLISIIFHYLSLQLFWTLLGLGFLENLRAGDGGGGAGGRGEASKNEPKKHALSQSIFAQFTWNFVLILYWQYRISLEKKIGKCHFYHHLMTSSWKSCVDVF